MRDLSSLFRHPSGRPYVRPWALATPIAVLLICLPLLRPLRHPGQVSLDEELRLATISALAQHWNQIPVGHRLAIDNNRFPIHSHLVQVDNELYSDQPPMLAFLLSGPAFLLRELGYPISDAAVLAPYILTLLGATLPTAAAAGLIYRLGRLFELRRPVRTALAAVVVFSSGLISYAVVLNTEVPAAVLVLASAGCLIHVSATRTNRHIGWWLALCGCCAAFAATIDLGAVIFLPLFLLAIPFMPWSRPYRVGAVLAFLLGTLPPLFLHAALVGPITGNLLPGSFHPELSPHHRTPEMSDAESPPDAPAESQPPATEDEEPIEPTYLQSTTAGIGSLLDSLLGRHGLLVHFPIVLLSVAGIDGVLRRHWPRAIKILAASSVLSIVCALLLIALFYSAVALGPEADFANRYLVVFIPFLIFWTGAWLRRDHTGTAWTIAAVLFCFSVFVSLIGATNPMPPGGYGRYTALSALVAVGK